MDIVVAGAGIGGLTAAIGLARDGHRVQVVERDDTPMPDNVEDAFAWDRRGAPQVRHTHGFPTLIRIVLRDYEILERSHPEPLIHVTQSPWDWNSVDMIGMCDATNIVIDHDHGARYERMQSARGVTMTLEQARGYIRFVAETRLWDYHWPPLSMDPQFILERLAQFGIDVSPWMA